MADKELSEAEIEAQLEAALQQAKAGGDDVEVVEEGVEPVEEPTTKADGVDPEEAKARADGHVSYEEWVAAGKDPRAWRSADEFNRRGEMLKTPKPDLIEKVEKMTRAAEEQSRLVAEQIRIAREEREAARREGYEQAIREAREEQERAFALGDRDAMRAAQEREIKAAQAIQQTATDPRQDPELQQWQAESKWFTEGFDTVAGRSVPKNEAVETFLVFQKDYMLNNPQARIIDSVRYAEGKVKKAMPQFFAPKTQQARTTVAAVESGNRTVKPQNDPLAKYSAGERSIIQQAAKAFGVSVKDYIKQIEEGK